MPLVWNEHCRRLTEVFLRQFDGEKKLFVSPINKTAIAIVENRAKACEVVQAIQTDKKPKNLLGVKVEATLLKPDTPAIVCHEWDPQNDASKIESYFQGGHTCVELQFLVLSSDCIGLTSSVLTNFLLFLQC